MASKRLTDISSASTITNIGNYVIHVVDTTDFTDYSAGTSYKTSLQNIADAFSPIFTFTGGTILGPTNFVNGITASTINNLILTALTDTFVTGFTYDNSNKLTISQNQGQQDISVYINHFSGLTINGILSATTYYGDGQYLTGIASTDNFVTGGTYLNGILTLDRQNGSVIITGFTTNHYTTNETFSTNETKTLNHNLNTKFVHCSVWDTSTEELVTVQLIRTTGNTNNALDVTIATAGNYDIIITGLGNITQYITNETFSAGETKTLNHNLNTKFIHCSVWDSYSNDLITPLVVRTTGNTSNALDVTIATAGNYDIIISK